LELLEPLLAHAFGFGSESAPLSVSEQKSLMAQVFAKDAVFLLEIVNDVTLMTIDPAGEGE
jgi:hypothetical protein